MALADLLGVTEVSEGPMTQERLGKGQAGGRDVPPARATMLRKGMVPMAPICPLYRSSHSSAGPEEEEPVQILRRDRR